jgi:hypothetical protein
MPLTCRITRTLQIVYGLVLCALIAAFVLTSHHDELPRSMKDLALRGRATVNSHEFPSELSKEIIVNEEKEPESGAKIPVLDLEADKNQESARDTSISEPNEHAIPTIEQSKHDNALNEESTSTEDPSMPMPHDMLQQLKNIYVDAHAKYADESTVNRVTATPTAAPTTSAIIVKEVPLVLSIPLASIPHLDPKEAEAAWTRSLAGLYHSHWSDATLKASAHEEHSAQSASAKSVSMLNDFHSALKYGQICGDVALKDLRQQQRSSSSKYSYRTSSSDMSAVNALAEMRRAAVREVMSAKSALFLEHSQASSEELASAAASFSVSSNHPMTSSILFDSSTLTPAPGADSQHTGICMMDRFPDIRYPPSNVFITKPLAPEAASTPRWNQAFDCVQLVSSFESIFSQDTDPLPFDMEDALGWALCRCNVTIVPSKLPATAFFSYWESVDMLVAEAILATNGACAVTVNISSAHAPVSSSTSSKYSTSSSRASSPPPSHHLYVYREDSSVKLSPLPAATVMSSQLSPSSRSHMMAFLALVHGQTHSTSRPAPPAAPGETSTREVLEEMLSLDISHRRRHQPTRGSKSRASDGASSPSSHHSKSSSYASGSSSGGSSAKHSSYSSSYHAHSSHSTSSSGSDKMAASYHSGELPVPDVVSSGVAVDEAGRRQVNESSTDMDKSMSSFTSAERGSTEENATDGSAAGSTAGSARKLLVYSYVPKTYTSSSSSSSGSTSSTSTSSSNGVTLGMSSVKSNSSSMIDSSTSTVLVDSFREPASKRLHVLPPLTYSFWSTRSHTMHGTDELDAWIEHETLASLKDAGKIPSTMRYACMSMCYLRG